MTEGTRRPGAQDMLDVRRAAALLGRHPETVRRWVWSGRLAASRQGNRLLMTRADVEAMATQRGAAIGLAEWADRARAQRDVEGANGSGRSAAELVIEDRAYRSRELDGLAGR